MNVLNNMKTSVKLIGSFMIIAVLTAVVGVLGIIYINQIDAADTRLYQNQTVPISQLQEMSVSFQRIRVNLRDIILAKTPQETQQYAFPAAINDAEIVKEITVKDENSVTGEIVTRLFQLKFINGQWETRLLLTVTESRPIYDSSQAKKDSIILINPVQ